MNWKISRIRLSFFRPISLPRRLFSYFNQAIVNILFTVLNKSLQCYVTEIKKIRMTHIMKELILSLNKNLIIDYLELNYWWHTAFLLGIPDPVHVHVQFHSLPSGLFYLMSYAKHYQELWPIEKEENSHVDCYITVILFVTHWWSVGTYAHRHLYSCKLTQFSLIAIRDRIPYCTLDWVDVDLIINTSNATIDA